MALLCGILPFTVALAIFFIWWIARSAFAHDLDSFETIGFLWMLIAIPVATLGIVSLMIFAIKNYPHFLKKSLFALVLILINLPTAYWILWKQKEIERKAYVKINYKGVFNLENVRLIGENFEQQLGDLDGRSSKVVAYQPTYISAKRRQRYPEVEPVVLIFTIKQNKQSITLNLPRIEKGTCKNLYIDKEFNIVEKWE